MIPWIPAAAWAGLLVFLSSRPSLPAPQLSHFDKVAHFVAYAVLGTALAHAVSRSGWPLVVAVVLGLAFGASDELHQSLVPGRDASFLDWVADAAGVTVAVLVYARWRHHRAARRPGASSDAEPLRV
jgi:VanZ family protein